MVPARLSPVVRLLCTAALGAGVALRLDGLARKPLWYDESATMLHLSGRREGDLRILYDGRSLVAGDLAWDGPRRPAPIVAVVGAVAADEPQIGPGYFVLASLWTRCFGGGRIAVRALSATAGVLTLALLFALARQFGGEGDVALPAAALAAVSPLHLRYAQEARPYATWSAVLLGGALAVRYAAARTTLAPWMLCAAVLAIALSVQPLTVLALPALAVAGDGRGRRRGVVRRFALATLAAAAAAAAWVVVSWQRRAIIAVTTGWAGRPIETGALVRSWLGMVTSLFYRPAGAGGLLDGAPWPPLVRAMLWFALGLCASLVAVAAVWALARGSSPLRRFVPLLVVVPAAVPALLDVVLGGRRSTVARYLVPSWIGVELAVAWWVVAVPAARWRQLVLVAFLVLGAATAIRTQPLDAWWDTDVPRQHALDEIARRVAARAAPIVISDLPPLALLELAARLAPQTALRLGATAPRTLDADERRHAVLVAPSATLLAEAQQVLGPTERLVAEEDGLPLWHVAPE